MTVGVIDDSIDGGMLDGGNVVMIIDGMMI